MNLQLFNRLAQIGFGHPIGLHNVPAQLIRIELKLHPMGIPIDLLTLIGKPLQGGRRQRNGRRYSVA